MYYELLCESSVRVFECTDGDGSRTRGSTSAMAASYMTVINKFKIKVLIEDDS